MDLGLSGRAAIVTGASRGLGRAVARSLAGEGCRVVVNARGEERLREAAAGIEEATGTRVIAVPGDVREEATARRLVEAATGELGRLDVLVTNAGGPPSGGFGDLEPAAYEEALELNLLSAVRLVHAAVPVMKEAGWGRIVAITSVSVKQPIPGLLLSNMARPGVVGFIKSIATELAPHGILCNCVAPGYMATERVEELLRDRAEASGRSVEEIRDEQADAVPVGRIGDPAELGDVVAFLASERASYLTGLTLQVDGGYVKGLL